LHNHRATATKKESVVGRLSGQDKFTPVFHPCWHRLRIEFSKQNPFFYTPPSRG
jgi:hypothetical protein